MAGSKHNTIGTKHAREDHQSGGAADEEGP